MFGFEVQYLQIETVLLVFKDVKYKYKFTGLHF
jgi:hypothetical protein